MEALSPEQWALCFKESQEELAREQLQRQMTEDEKLRLALFPRRKLDLGQDISTDISDMDGVER